MSNFSCQISCNISGATGQSVSVSECACQSGYTWSSTALACDKNKSSSVGLIVGVTVGGVLLIVSIAVGAYFCCRTPPPPAPPPVMPSILKTETNLQSMQSINSLFYAGPHSSVAVMLKINVAILNDMTCSICLMENTNCSTNCRHRFHRECLKLWMTKDASCPNCRRAISSIR